uniref:Uncharacterized protein n=1 Tax=Glossina brevipalpis TaxID=37001 RepID=A0A1A9X1S3_9MUSC
MKLKTLHWSADNADNADNSWEDQLAVLLLSVAIVLLMLAVLLAPNLALVNIVAAPTSTAVEGNIVVTGGSVPTPVTNVSSASSLESKRTVFFILRSVKRRESWALDSIGMVTIHTLELYEADQITAEVTL